MEMCRLSQMCCNKVPGCGQYHNRDFPLWQSVQLSSMLFHKGEGERIHALQLPLGLSNASESHCTSGTNCVWNGVSVAIQCVLTLAWSRSQTPPSSTLKSCYIQI